MMFPKHKQWRDEKWLLAQREMACVYSGHSEVEVAHVRAGSHTGMSQKPHDHYTMPLRFDLHRQQHGMSEVAFHLMMTGANPQVLMEMS